MRKCFALCFLLKVTLLLQLCFSCAFHIDVLRSPVEQTSLFTRQRLQMAGYQATPRDGVLILPTTATGHAVAETVECR